MQAIAQSVLNIYQGAPPSVRDETGVEIDPMTLVSPTVIEGVMVLVRMLQDDFGSKGHAKDLDEDQWISTWLIHPVMLLENKRPIELLRHAEQHQLVRDLLGRGLAGVFS